MPVIEEVPPMSTTTVKGMVVFDEPVTLQTALDALVVEPDFILPKLPPTADGGLGLTRAAQEDMLNGYVAGLTAPKIVLFEAPEAYDPERVIGDLTQPTGTWYTAGGIAFTHGTIYKDADGRMHVTGHSVQFQHNGTDPSVEIGGYALTDTVP